MFEIIKKRVTDGVCIEFFDAENDDDDDKVRVASNHNKNFIRAARLERFEEGSWIYVSLLIDYVDHEVKTFPVVDVVKYEGRDLTGSENERGSFSAHMVIRLPKEGLHDDGNYRCAIESVANVNRRNIEHLLSRQLRRNAKGSGWFFTVVVSDSSKKEKTKEYQYYPKLQLLADVGRSLFGKEGKMLSHVVFTNRSEKQAIAQATAVTHEDLYATVEVKIAAKQGPEEPEQQKRWLQSLKDYYQMRGYETKMYFRHLKGDQVSGAVHPALASAADLLMCPRESIFTASEPRKWVGEISAETRDRMRELLDRDELWQLAK
ncbi:hypothetical protein [Mesorhizobium jarvisii]|uniref:hypothetical protein n=1 Tax=Mesorhizobium jarvisii TaxID=1777867 RepID=UPI001F0A448F|nr:hypothetical protein [Mesorhizobium jarvisii]MCH4560340.1 hypothetical protein [Mesorhizobium jarvisii]